MTPRESRMGRFERRNAEARARCRARGRILAAFRILVALCAASNAPAGAAPAPVEVYVAVDGRPEWSGRLAAPNADRSDGPLPSVAAARDAIRARRGDPAWAGRSIEVRVRGGTYALSEPLVFGPEDSGRPDSPITYVAYERERPVLSGAQAVTGWRAVELNGRPAWAADVPAAKSGTGYFRQFFVNGARRPRVRIPKEGFRRFAGIPGIAPDHPWSQGQGEVEFAAGDLRRWANLGDVEVVALTLWIESRMPIAAVDEAARRVTFTRPSVFSLHDGHDKTKFARYYVENVREALDTPGQWYLDRAEGVLYYLPMPGEAPESATAAAPRLPQLVRIAGGADGKSPVHDLRFVGLTFRHADWALPPGQSGTAQAAVGVPGAIALEHAARCEIRDGEVSGVSTYAIEVGAGCEEIGVVNNVLTDLGAGGVKVWHGSRATRVVNNEIGPGGLQFHSAVGVLIGHSSDNVVAHNHIHHLYYTGVSVGWTWGYVPDPAPAVRNRIEYNHIHDLGAGFLDDMGGIYTLGISPGTVLRCNRIHDVNAYGYGGWGLYNDEGSSGMLLENNIVYRTSHGGYHQHYGRGNVIRNNVFAFGKAGQVIRSREEEHESFLFERNIVYFSEGPLLGSVWSNGNYRFADNVYWHTGMAGLAAGAPWPFDFAGLSFADWKAKGRDERSVVADPLFVDPAHGDFSLKPESPALKLGFQPIDAARIGRLPAPP